MPVLLLSPAGAMAAAEPARSTKAPTVAKADGKATIQFGLSRQTDVEVAILDAIINVRVLRIRKTFQLEISVKPD